MEKTVLLSVLNLNPISDYDELFELEKVSFEESKEILKLQIEHLYLFDGKLTTNNFSENLKLHFYLY